jgi:DNA-binding NarL/FixJ family response regulator
MRADEKNNNRVCRVLLVDDHKMVRDGLRVMLGSLKKALQFDTDEAESGEEALKKVSRNDYELLIIDYHMPGISGAETISRILRYRNDIKILAVSNYDELPYIQGMIDAGAHGYVLKNIEPAQLLLAIRTILSGKIYYSNEVATKIIEGRQKETEAGDAGIRDLTKREIEVLKLIALEMTNEEIAKKLVIGKRTVDAHRQNLLNKLHVKNTVGLIKFAYKSKLIG